MRELTKAHLTTEENLNSTLVAKRDEMAVKQARLKRIFDEAGPRIELAKVTSISGAPEQKRAEITRLNDELNDLGQEVNFLALQEKNDDRTPVYTFPFPDGGSGGVRGKSVGDAFIKSVAYQHRVQRSDLCHA